MIWRWVDRVYIRLLAAERRSQPKRTIYLPARFIDYSYRSRQRH